MFITLDTALPVITLLVVAYQAYSLYELDKDIEELVDKHNEKSKHKRTKTNENVRLQQQDCGIRGD
jgi:hypothetical protein